MINLNLKSLGLPVLAEDKDYVDRVLESPLDIDEFHDLRGVAKKIGVTPRFKDVIKTFASDKNKTPAGFKHVLTLNADQVLLVDLVRDISYDANGELRPTNVLFSADSANPYEVAPIAPLIANLTCNPGIIYDLFINNPKANVGNKYTTRDEVMQELANILGPGVDVSVELNNPWADYDEILEECAKFRDMFSPYRIVIKVPHFGPVTKDNVNQLLEGEKLLDTNFADVTTAGTFASHNLALNLHNEGYRVNYTLMFEPYQTQLALQARPYFINTFLRHRMKQSEALKGFLALNADGDKKAVEDLKSFFVKNDYYTKKQAAEVSDKDALAYAQSLLRYRHFDDAEGSDGLDGMRHNLRALRNSNMEDTRLIVCSMEGPDNYPDIDKLLMEDDFIDMHDRVVITAEPNYLARFTSTNQVVSYQRRFMNAAKGQA